MDDDVAAAFEIADEFLRTFNELDAAGHAATLAYPHVRLASGTVRVYPAVYVVVQNDDGWRIQARSSYAP